MLTSLEPKAGHWILVAGPSSLNPALLALAARLAGNSPVRVLDGGNRFNAFPVARIARGRPAVLERITIARAFTCHQVLSLLESTPTGTAPFLVLDILRTFYDEAVPFRERRQLLAACLEHLRRLAGPAGGLVSAHPPAIPGPQTVRLLGLLQAAAGETRLVQIQSPPVLAPRLF